MFAYYCETSTSAGTFKYKVAYYAKGQTCLSDRTEKARTGRLGGAEPRDNYVKSLFALSSLVENLFLNIASLQVFKV